jgi:hypothetical protein
MPLIITLGALSARGEGFQVAESYTFPPGTSTWTAPSGTSSLISITGIGSSGTSDGYSKGVVAEIDVLPVIATGLNTPPPVPWSVVNNEIPVLISGFSFTGPTAAHYITLTFEVGTDGSVSGISSTGAAIKCYGQAYVDGPTNSIPTSGYIPSSGAYGHAYIFVPNLLTTGHAGSATVGFGFTFPGGAYISGVGYPAGSLTMTNVPVTPGQTYTVTNNGSLTISYYS